MQVQGKFYPEGSSQCLSADVLLSQAGVLSLRVTEQDLCLDIARDELQIKDKLGSIPREIVLRERGLLSLDPTAEIDDWLATNQKNNVIAKLESSRPLVLLSLVLVPAFLYCFFKYLIPSAAVHFAEYVPDTAVKIASNHTLISMDKIILDESKLSEEVQQTFINQWQETLAKLNLSDHGYNLNFRYSEKMGANAFALPDGTVVVTDALITLIDHDADLLRAILLHEIGHVEHKHSMRLIAETLATSLAIDYFFGDLGGVLEVFAGLSNTIVQNQFSQKLEWEADEFALVQLQALGLDKESFAQAMEKLAETLPEGSNLDALMQSHPLMKDRIENARRNK